MAISDLYDVGTAPSILRIDEFGPVRIWSYLIQHDSWNISFFGDEKKKTEPATEAILKMVKKKETAQMTLDRYHMLSALITILRICSWVAWIMEVRNGLFFSGAHVTRKIFYFTDFFCLLLHMQEPLGKGVWVAFAWDDWY